MQERSNLRPLIRRPGPKPFTIRCAYCSMRATKAATGLGVSCRCAGSS